MSQPIHRVFISGVSEEAATAYLGRALFEALNAQWVAPEQSVALAQEDESAHWLWLYQPPWQLADATPPEWVAWVAQHQPALRLQRVSSQVCRPGERELSTCVPSVASRVPMGYIPGPTKWC